jgi:hypothetical protein
VSELEFIQIDLEMLPADGTMIGADPTSLEQRQCVVGLLERVGGEVAFLPLDML